MGYRNRCRIMVTNGDLEDHREGRIILRCILRKRVLRMWHELNWIGLPHFGFSGAQPSGCTTRKSATNQENKPTQR